MVIPKPKSQNYSTGSFKGELCFIKCDISDEMIRMINTFSPRLSCTYSGEPTVITQSLRSPKKGAYKITVAKEKIFISFGDREGLRNAVATLCQLENGGEIACTEISDAPENQFRSCMLDLARGYVEPEVLKEHIIRLAFLKFNVLHLHLMDRQSYALDSAVVPNPDRHRGYSAEELRELVAFCKGLAIEVIPEIEFPAHAVNLLKALPELACDLIDEQKAKDRVLSSPKLRSYYINEQNISSWTVCLGSERTYDIYKKIIDEIIGIFDSDYIHIGGDEINFHELGAFPNWDNCHHCRKIADAHGYDDLALYHYGIRRINDILKSRGKHMIKWVESGELYRTPDLPRDIILEYWITHNADNAQNEIEHFIAEGFTLINAQYQYTYVDMGDYMTAQKIRSWSPAVTETQRKAIAGGEMCAWELGNPDYSFYPHTLPVCAVLFADRVWNSAATEYTSEYLRSIFSVLLGKNIKSNPLGLFEKIIPPRKKDILSDIRENISKEELESTVSELEGIEKGSVYGRIALATYIDTFKEKLKTL